MSTFTGELPHIRTTGCIFPDGSIIEQVRGNQLLLWAGGQIQTASIVEYGGRTYAASVLDATLHDVMYLPTGIDVHWELDDLIADLQAPLVTTYGFDQDSALLMAVAIIATWVADSIAAPLIINLWGQLGSEDQVLEFLACTCRHALRLAEPSPRHLASLPFGLAPTMILRRPTENTLRRLIAAAEPDTCFLSAGKLVRARSPVICTSTRARLSALNFPLLSLRGTATWMTRTEAQALVDRLQPRLLGFRLFRHHDVANSKFDVSALCPQVRPLGRIIGAVAESSQKLQQSIMTALKELFEQHNPSHLPDRDAAEVEALLIVCHEEERPPSVFVGRIATLATAILATQGIDEKVSPRAVGELLRQHLGVTGRRRNLGYEIAVDRHFQQCVHRFALTYDLLKPVQECHYCEEILISAKSGNACS